MQRTLVGAPPRSIDLTIKFLDIRTDRANDMVAGFVRVLPQLGIAPFVVVIT